jgi:hypothetical protein
MLFKSSHKKFLITFLGIVVLVIGFYLFISKTKAKHPPVVTVSSMTFCSDPKFLTMITPVP